ncbi:glycosyltransferase family 2 protein [Peribacillus butanolivorans]|uniref:glycosyltransferase family 2 protein n=1 Tax=Peribacillus butanolivorans TaxID=421767 RepID=UPI0006A71180|nr:glycosyltransferase [Peribacillus butanolivorans]
MTYSKPLISVIIPTYNRGYVIKKTINSVLQQTYDHFEIIIIDDASNDNTESIVKSIKDKRIKYIKLQENTKGTKPRNVGINVSNGEYIAFLDSDDEWLPTKLEKQLKFILSFGEINTNIICFTRVIIKDEKLEIYRKNKPLNKNEDIMDYILVGNNVVQTSTFMISNAIAKKTLFDPGLKKHQDWDFCLRLRNNNATFFYLPECLTVWNVDKERNDRISNSYKKQEISLDWLNSKKNELSLKSQWAFKMIIVDYLIDRRERTAAMKIIFTAFFHRSISFMTLLKKLTKVFLPYKIHGKIKLLLKKI